MQRTFVRRPQMVIQIIFTASIVFSLSACNKDCRAKGDPGSCICLAIYAPVCGCNGKTYENSCRAECVGINDYSEGECD